jgi:hypothetical protein
LAPLFGLDRDRDALVVGLSTPSFVPPAESN